MSTVVNQDKPNDDSRKNNEEDDGVFRPKVYRFRFSPALNDCMTMWGLEEMNAVAPSFTNLMDHTIAVIYYLFHENGKHLGRLTIADLMWALKFIEALDNTRISELDDQVFFTTYIRTVISLKYALLDEKEYADLTSTVLDISIKNTSKFFSQTVEDYFKHPDVTAAVLNEPEEEIITEEQDPRDILIKEAAQKISQWVDSREQQITLDDVHRKSMENLRDKLARV